MHASDIAISVEQLSKSYVISHQGTPDRYVSLRDTIAGGARGFALKALDLFRGRESLTGNVREEFWALQDVAFEVKRGEVLGVVGRNGAGKSTLLKVLSRITEPTRGSARIRGRVASLLEVGTGFHPELTGRENIFLNGAVLGMTRAEIRRKFDEIVAFAGVEKFLDTPVKRFSSGMYVRLAFAVAAHLEPEILVVDEVLAVGDAEFQKRCLGKMNEVARGGRTVLFVSHNMSAVRSLCDTAILLEGGKCVMKSSASDVTNRYLQGAVNSTALSVSTAQAKRVPGHGVQARITNFQINDGGGLFHGMPAKFTFELAAFRDVSDLALAVGIYSMDGGRVMSIDSDIPGDRIALGAGSQVQGSMTIDKLHLEPTTYSVDVALRSGDNYLVDYVSEALSVTVLPSESTPAAIAMRTTGHGGVRYPCSTELKSRDPSARIAEAAN